ncbi:autotransporter outer membrane beta-barrel domain-containing protein [Terasakiella sp. SH-1]|uniref:autotransporter family protein n=1 Tax=Terasakiella sp. SH-1 TaxID=2560057 RepID=UPI0010730114|nr:autotransporter outer membrane beta-barrel domain-containing protein [Terasakiella sp. SH-1]
MSKITLDGRCKQMNIRFFLIWAFILCSVFIGNHVHAASTSVNWTTSTSSFTNANPSANGETRTGTLGATTVTLTEDYNAINSGQTFAATWADVLPADLAPVSNNIGMSVAYTSTQTATVTITFSASVSNPYVMLNWVDENTTYDFSPNGTGVTSLVGSAGAGATYSLANDKVSVSGSADTANHGFGVRLTGSFTSLTVKITRTSGGDQTAGISVATSEHPSITISSAEISSGDTSTHDTLSLTFTSSKTTTTFASGDVTVANGSISNFAGSGTTYTATLTPSGPGVTVTVDIAASTYTSTVGGLNNFAAAQFVWNTSPTPMAKADVVGTVEASSKAALNYAQANRRMVNTRLQWLRNNKTAEHKSRQGIKVRFANPYLDQFVNGTSQGFKSMTGENAPIFLQKYAAAYSAETIAPTLKTDLIETTMGELRDQMGGFNLNPTGGTLVKDWSVWTEGQITIGEVDETADSSLQKSKTFALTLGLDRPFWNEGVLGFSMTYGHDDVKIGTVGSRMKSNNYTLSTYSTFKTQYIPQVELSLGAGRMHIKNNRIDGTQTLTGDRNADFITGYVKMFDDPIKVEDFTFTPYGQLETSYIKMNRFEEAGGSEALVFDTQHINRRMAFLGFDATYQTDYADGRFMPYGALEYGYDFTGKSDVGMRYANASTAYTLQQEKIASSHWMFRIGTDYSLDETVKASVSYERSIAVSAGHADTFRLKLSMSF